MAADLILAVLELAEHAGTHGVAMGTLVDTLEAQGFAVEDIEQHIWHLMGARRLTPAGYICRTLERRSSGASRRQRMYEFTLVPWSPQLDHQLELELEGPLDPNRAP